MNKFPPMQGRRAVKLTRGNAEVVQEASADISRLVITQGEEARMTTVQCVVLTADDVKWIYNYLNEIGFDWEEETRHSEQLRKERGD